MHPQRLRTFLNKPADGSVRLELSHDSVVGLQPVADWSRADLKGDLDECIAAIIGEAQDHADGQDGSPKTVPFALRWLGDNGQNLGTARHRVKPVIVDEGDELETRVERAGGPTEVWIPALLKALLDKDKALNEAYKTSLEAAKETITMLQAQSSAAFKMAEQMRNEKPVVIEPIELTTEQREEALQRAKAWQTLSDIAPDLGALAMAVATNKLLPDAPGLAKAKDATPKSNGHANKAA